ncbi:MAG: PEP-CTERM system histidine kinase PrsK [Verrucomicrobiae bacterium]|nr:PEP-CTERM system histidine kinase PrsK [Verrucomicrobiae bacterium]
MMLVHIAAALVAGCLGGVAVFHPRKGEGPANLLFASGMLLIALDAVVAIGVEHMSLSRELYHFWVTGSLCIESTLLGIWLWFSVCFGRGNYREFMRRWRWAILLAFVLPIAALVMSRQMLEFALSGLTEDLPLLLWRSPGRALNVVMLLLSLLILANLENTFRSAVGTARWRIKFLVLGVAIMFGVRVYVFSSAVVFPAYDTRMDTVNSIAVLIACPMMGLGYTRQAFQKVDIYPSRDFLVGSLTVMIAGSFLLAVGLLAQLTSWLGGSGEAFVIQTIIVIVGLAGISTMLVSERARVAIKQYVARHFHRPTCDFRDVWSRVITCSTAASSRQSWCVDIVKLVSQTFNALSVTLIELDANNRLLRTLAATGPPVVREVSTGTPESLSGMTRPFALESLRCVTLRDALQAMTPEQFHGGGGRLGVPLIAENRNLGFLILGDRVNALPFTHEERQLLECIASQVGAELLNQRLAGDVIRARELEAFQTMSAFFVHDLKNAASTLNLTLQNFPKHFDNPEFRKDALRSIATTTERINHLIRRLSALRENLEVQMVPSAVDALIRSAVTDLQLPSAVEISLELSPVPPVSLDQELFKSVVRNLVQNAADSLPDAADVTGGGGWGGAKGEIRVTCSKVVNGVSVSVIDNGPGMTEDFVNNLLFTPFQSTKKDGLGIGMFQSRVIVEKHGGQLEVESAPGRGTTVTVILPLGGVSGAASPASASS